MSANVRLGLHPAENIVSMHFMQAPPGKSWSVYPVRACDAVGCRVIWRVVQLAAGCSLFPVQTDGSPLLSAHKTPTSKRDFDVLKPRPESLELFIHRKAIK